MIGLAQVRAVSILLCPPLQYICLKVIAFPFSSECVFNLVHIKPRENKKIRKYLYARQIKTIFHDLYCFDHFT